MAPPLVPTYKEIHSNSPANRETGKWEFSASQAMLGTQEDTPHEEYEEQPHTQHTQKLELCSKTLTTEQYKSLRVNCEMLTVFTATPLMPIQRSCCHLSEV